MNKLGCEIERAMRLLQGLKNHLSLSDNEIITLYKNTQLDNKGFCTYASNLCKRSAGSIRAMLVVNNVYVIEGKL